MERADIEEFIRIDRNNLDEEFIRHPELVFHTHMGYVRAVSTRDAVKRENKRLEASFYLKTKRGEIKHTETEIKQLAAKNAKLVDRLRLLDEADRECAAWDALRETMKQRGYALKEIAALVTASNFGNIRDNSHKDSPAQERHKKRRSTRRRTRD